MKTSIDIPDELYRRVKAKSALQGRHVRDVTIELYERWVADERADVRNDREAALRWLDGMLKLGAELFEDAPPGPTTREILSVDRDRLERP